MAADLDLFKKFKPCVIFNGRFSTSLALLLILPKISVKDC
jgi:hypothetical protein